TTAFARPPLVRDGKPGIPTLNPVAMPPTMVESPVRTLEPQGSPVDRAVQEANDVFEPLRCALDDGGSRRQSGCVNCVMRARRRDAREFAHAHAWRSGRFP